MSTRSLRWAAVLPLLACVLGPATAAWREPTNDDISIGVSPMTIVQPVELAGPLTFAHTSVAGPLFPAAAPDYLLRARWLLPHSDDRAHAGCEAFAHATNDEGDEFAGAFLMLERGGCSFADKVVHASQIALPNGGQLAGVIIYGCPTCAPGLQSMAAFDRFPVPAIYVAIEDGQAVQEYLLQRRASFAALTVGGVLTQPAACSEPANQQSAANATAAGCVLPAFEGTVIGTGELVASEKEALLTLAGGLTFDPSYFDYDTWLRPWADFIVHPEVDPCLNRLTGLWCEAGHIVSIDVSGIGVSGTFPPGSFRAFTELRFLVALVGRMEGPLPNDLCWLTKLQTMQLDDNAFTSLPECLGGGTFPDGPGGAAVTYPGAQSLRYLAASNNALTNLPASLGRLSNLQTLAAFQNQIDQEFPRAFFSMSSLRLLELFGNPNLRFDWDAAGEPPPTFQNLTNLYSLLLRSTSFRGHLPLNAFDGMAELVTVDFSAVSPDVGGLTGELPTFRGCAKLKNVAFRQNRLVGGIPSNWPDDASNIQTLSLAYNQLGAEPGSFDVMSSLKKLENILLSRNNLTTSLEDFGESFFNMIPTSAVQVYLDRNHLTGHWVGGWLGGFTKLRILNVAHNSLTQLPTDMWNSFFSVVDFSFNDLTGSLPAQSPSIFEDPLTGRPAVLQFSVEGNPRLVVESLPGWMKFSDPPRYTLSVDGIYQCRALAGSSEALRISVDPTFTNFKECLCVRGSFGIPPLCPPLPQSAIVSPYSLPSSSEVGSDFTTAIGYQPRQAPVVTPQNETATVPFVQHPDAFSDAWYGTNRFTSGMGTHWDVDLTRLLLPTSQLANETNAQVVVLGEADPARLSTPTASLSDPFQAVRVITVRLHLSRADFDSDSAVFVYAGSISGERVGVVSGKDRATLAALPTSSEFTRRPEYQASYGALIANLADPVLLEVPVLSPRATVSFESRSPSGVHFVASYSYSFRCPEGYELPDAQMASTTQASCVQPTLGARSSVLILLLGIGGALVAFAFLWLMYERWQRHKAASMLRSQSVVATGTVEASDEDLQSDAARRLNQLRNMAYQRLIKEIVFELVSLVWEVTSTVLNWVVVGQVLAGGTSNLRPLSVGYIVVVVISTFAVGANGVSRVMGLLQLRQAVEAEAVLRHRAQRASIDTAEVDKVGASDASDLATEADVRKTIDEVQRKLQRLRVAALSLVLHSLPFVVLNLVTFYDATTVDRSSASVTVQVSLLMSFLLMGMKLEELKTYPNQKRLLAVSELKMVQLKLQALHGAGGRRTMAGRRTRGATAAPAASSPVPAATAANLADAPANDEDVRPPVSPQDAVLEVADGQFDRPRTPTPPPPQQQRRRSSGEEEGMEMATL